jgi:hypothetical protein
VLAFLAAALAAFAPSPAPASPATEPPAAQAPADGSDILETSMPWWERITVTVDDKGKQQSCRYEISLSPSSAEACDQEIAASVKADRDGRLGVYSKVTIERRFSPGGRLDAGRLQPGDTLIGRQVMFLTFDAKGAIESCKVVASSGDARPDYDCDAAKKEQFRAQASADPAARQAFMTILAYGHTEHIA